MVAGANSYASVAVFRQYALDQGAATVPADDGEAMVMLYQAMRYIEALESRFQGVRTSAYLQYSVPATLDQPLSWPRQGVTINGVALLSLAIPQQLIDAQCQLGCDASAGNTLLPTVATTGNLKKKIRGPITDEYFDPRYVSATPAARFVAADDLLSVLCAGAGLRGGLRSVRI